jgi:predicted MFS family arabinose efflux permease
MPIVPVRWRMLFVLFLARTAMAYQFQTVASDGPFLIDTLGIGYAELGTLIGLYMLPGIVIALPGGMLGQRFGAKRVTLIGLGLMAVGGVMMSVDSVPLVFVGRLVSGLGAVFVNVLMTKMVADWFAGREIVTAMAVFVSSWPAGIALGLISFPPLATAFSWVAVMQVAAAVATVCLVLVALIYRAPPDAPPETGRLQLNLSRREWLLISLAGFVWGTFNAAYVILISFLPELFAQRGYSLAEASRLVSLLAWAVIASVPLAGYLAERLRWPNLTMLGGLAVSAVAIAALPLAGAPILPFVLMVIVIGLPPGPMMALASEALRPENRAAGMGVFYTWHYAAMTVLPALAGVAREFAATPAAPSLFAAALMVLSAAAVIGLRLRQRGDSTAH